MIGIESRNYLFYTFAEAKLLDESINEIEIERYETNNLFFQAIIIGRSIVCYCCDSRLFI